MQEPSSDLAIAVALASSYWEQPVARDMAVIGAPTLSVYYTCTVSCTKKFISIIYLRIVHLLSLQI